QGRVREGALVPALPAQRDGGGDPAPALLAGRNDGDPARAGRRAGGSVLDVLETPGAMIRADGLAEGRHAPALMISNIPPVPSPKSVTVVCVSCSAALISVFSRRLFVTLP